jgi:uncharacterized protein (UPF0333 family)
MRKAQGALEYLIIIAAVLAIAAIVVLFLTGAFTSVGKGGDIAKCRLAAANCASNIANGVYATATACQTPCFGSCSDATGKDVMSGTILVSPCTAGTACMNCSVGNTSNIRSP